MTDPQEGKPERRDDRTGYVDHGEAMAQGRSYVPPTGEEDAPGREFGDFRLLHKLGSGGMGVVYLAHQKSLNRKVAIKLVHRNILYLGEGRGREDLLREAQAAGRLDHPAICPVHQVGETEGIPYLVMRHVEGESLAQRIRRAREAGETGPDRTSTLQVIAQAETVARALHLAHETELVHRDIKPGNIMITHDGEPVILDFGLAREEGYDHSQTLTGQVMGTPTYLPPERLSKEKVPLDRRADIYALAVTLFEALTLRLPFDGGSIETIYQAILTDAPPDLTRLNPNIPPDLKTVLEKALEKDPARRYPTALDLAEDLRRVRHYEPIEARRTGPWTRLNRWRQRNPVVALSLALVLLFLVLGFGTALYAYLQVNLALRTQQASSLAASIHRAGSTRQALRVLLEARRLRPIRAVNSALLEVLARDRLRPVKDSLALARRIKVSKTRKMIFWALNTREDLRSLMDRIVITDFDLREIAVLAFPEPETIRGFSLDPGHRRLLVITAPMEPTTDSQRVAHFQVWDLTATKPKPVATGAFDHGSAARCLLTGQEHHTFYTLSSSDVRVFRWTGDTIREIGRSRFPPGTEVHNLNLLGSDNGGSRILCGLTTRPKGAPNSANRQSILFVDSEKGQWFRHATETKVDHDWNCIAYLAGTAFYTGTDAPREVMALNPSWKGPATAYSGDASIKCIHATRGGKHLYLGLANGLVLRARWDPGERKLKVVTSWVADSKSILSLLDLPLLGRVATLSRSGRVRLWEASGQAVESLAATLTNKLSIHPLHNQLALVRDPDQQWAFLSLQPAGFCRFPIYRQTANAFQVDPYSDGVYYLDPQKRPWRWQGQGTPSEPLPLRATDLKGLFPSPRKGYFITHRRAQDARFSLLTHHHPDGRTTPLPVEDRKRHITLIAYSPDGLHAVASSSNTTWVFDLVKGTRRRFDTPTTMLPDLCFNPAGQEVVIKAGRGALLVPLDGGEPVRTPDHPTLASALSYSPGENLILTGDRHGRVILTRRERLDTPLARFTLVKPDITCLRMEPGGKRILTLCYTARGKDRTASVKDLSVWDTSGRHLATLPTPGGRALGCEWLGRSGLILFVSNRGFHVMTPRGEILVQSPTNMSNIYRFHLDRERGRLYTLHVSDSTLRGWVIHPTDLHQLALAKKPGPLTAEDRQLFRAFLDPDEKE